MAYPVEVPILSARDICRGSEDGPRGTHCLIGWSKTVFGCDNDEEYVCKRTIREVIGRNSIALFNDDPSNTKQRIATVWNLVMRDLGYVVGNPEAAKKRKGRK
jgi:hypothetical protein